LFDLCIYTIVHIDKLRKAEKNGGSGKFVEHNVWKTGRSLLNKARSATNVLPLLFADATDCSKLLYWAAIGDIQLGEKETQYSFHQLQRLPGSHKPQELRLKSTGKTIAPGFIRPYATCHTPDFLTTPKASRK